MIYILWNININFYINICENINVTTKGHLCVVFYTIKYIVSDYAIILQIIDVNKLFYIFFIDILNKFLMESRLNWLVRKLYFTALVTWQKFCIKLRI